MPPRKEAPKVDVFVEVVVILVTVMFVWLVWIRLQAYLQFNGGIPFWNAIIGFINSIYPLIIIVSVFLTLLALWGIITNLQKIKEINEEERLIYNNPPPPEVAGAPIQPAQNPRWEKIVTQSNSTNPSDWQAAIIDADAMLADLLQSKGYHGDGVGEMLKSVDKSDFLTLDSAWDAHKVRNQIAHPTPDFNLTTRETQRVIAEFEAVFKEFKII
jgi:hypothetical protein